MAAHSIRPLEAQDVEAVVHFWRRSREGAQPWLEARLAYRPEQDQAFFREVLMPSCDIWLVAGPKGPAAFLALEGEEIKQFYVDPADQGQGLGTTLLEHAKSVCPERLTLYTHQRNHRARRFYEWHGFRPVAFGMSGAPESEPDVFYEWQAAKVCGAQEPPVMNQLRDPRLQPPPTKSHVSVARVEEAWYVACRSSELGTSPQARTLLGVPMVLYRDGFGQAGALLDRCPHRNVRLSLGAVDERGWLACSYHGWRFDREGMCREVPGLLGGGELEARQRGVAAYQTCEQDGFVWVWAKADVPAKGQPVRIPHVDDPDSPS